MVGQAGGSGCWRAEMLTRAERMAMYVGIRNPAWRRQGTASGITLRASLACIFVA